MVVKEGEGRKGRVKDSSSGKDREGVGSREARRCKKKLSKERNKEIKKEREKEYCGRE